MTRLSRAGLEAPMHHHDHSDHHAHAAPGTSRQSRRRLQLVLVMSATYMVVEAVGGWLTGSLALIADASHLLSDVGALSLSLVAIWIARRPATPHRTYGHTRAEILAALVHGGALVAVAVLIAVEAVERLSHPPDALEGLGMMGIAAGALAVNLTGVVLLNAGRRGNLNLRGAWLHLLTDALGSMGVIVAGAAVWAFGWYWADPVASLAISLLVFVSALALLRDAADVLMETAPRHLDVDEVRRSLADLPAVLDVHDLHVWTVGNGEVAFSSHVVADQDADTKGLLGRMCNLLEERFGITHATIQIEGMSAVGDESLTEADAVCSGGCTAARVAAGAS
jgi:cobalt-zinc-cadmium efflux system protein